MASATALIVEPMLIVAPGNAEPVCRSVTFPERESWAAAKNGSSRAIDAANKFFKM